MSNGAEMIVHPETGGAAPMERWGGLTMVVSPAEAMRRVQELQAFVREVMVQGEDFGVIPGTQKPTLYQPGAQKLAELYGFSHRFETDKEVTRWDDPVLFFYQMRCVLTSRHDGRFIAEGLGSCNSREDKYAWRWVNESEIPRGVDKSTLKKKERETRRGNWVQYRLPNEDIASVVNTVLKMACKRAYIHAVVSATRSAGIFTQDVEDLPRDAFGEPEPTRSWGGAADLASKAAGAVQGKQEDPEAAKYLARLAEIGAKGTADDIDAITDELAERWPEGHRLYQRMSAAWGAARAQVRERAAAPMPPEETPTVPAVATKATGKATARKPAGKAPTAERVAATAVRQELPHEVVQAIARDGHDLDEAHVGAVIAALRAP